MSSSISTALRRLRQDLQHHLLQSDVANLCTQIGHRWRRDAQLTPFAILLWFLDQVLHGNTALQHVSLNGRRTFTASAYCRGRARLPLAVFRGVLCLVIQSLLPTTEAEGLWRGHRTFLIDDSSFSMPDTSALRNHSGSPSGQAQGCGFPVAKILAFFHAGTGLLLDVFAMPPRAREMSQVAAVHPKLKGGDVLVGDRGFCSYVHIASLLGGGVQAVLRAHQVQIVDFTPNRPHADPRSAEGSSGRPRSRWVRSLGRTDQVVQWLKPSTGSAWLDADKFAALAESITVRELRYQAGQPGFRTRSVTLVTTLLEATAYPPESIAELYRMRWQVEGYLRDLKQTMKVDVLRCQSLDGVLKELMVYAIAYNLVRLVMLEAARRQGVAVVRISFIDASRWLQQAGPGERLPRLVVNRSRPTDPSRECGSGVRGHTR